METFSQSQIAHVFCVLVTPDVIADVDTTSTVERFGVSLKPNSGLHSKLDKM
jgi:hypothetical protein